MPDGGLRFAPLLPRAELRDALRREQLFDAPLRILAEDVLGADAPIDFVAADRAGRVILVLIAEEGGDRELFTRAIAQRAWVRPRIRDWLQLAPALDVSPDAPVVARLLCPSFSSETRAAAADLGPDVLELATVRCVHNGALAGVLVEPLPAPSRPSPQAAVEPPRARPVFRSGLSEADLGLSPEEIREFGSVPGANRDSPR